jgi:arylsulfatase A-like enzyme
MDTPFPPEIASCLSGVDKLGLRQKTIIIFTSDNGAHNELGKKQANHEYLYWEFSEHAKEHIQNLNFPILKSERTGAKH